MVDQNPISGRNMEMLLDKYMTSGDILTHVYAWGSQYWTIKIKYINIFLKQERKGFFDLGHGAEVFHLQWQSQQ